MVEIDTGDYVQALAVLVLVIGLILLTARLVRRFGSIGTAGMRPAGKRRLQVLETRMLDPRHRLVLVALDDREHLLLVGSGTALRVDTIPAADRVDSRLSDHAR